MICTLLPYSVYAIIVMVMNMKEDAMIRELVERRKKLGLTQQQLADMCGIPQSTIGRIENGFIHPRLTTYLKIVEALGLDLHVRNRYVIKNLDRIDISKRKQVENCIEEIKRNPDITKLTVFGSAARNECTESSDLDLCITVVDNADESALHDTRVRIGRSCEYNCDLLEYGRLSEKLKNNITRTGVEVYELSR